MIGDPDAVLVMFDKREALIGPIANAQGRPGRFRRKAEGRRAKLRHSHHTVLPPPRHLYRENRTIRKTRALTRRLFDA